LRKNRGLDLAEAGSLDEEDVKAFQAFYFQTQGHAHSEQALPATMLHYDVICGFGDGIRESVLPCSAVGVSKENTLSTIGSALVMAVSSGASIVERAAQDVFDTWVTDTEGRPWT
jgi:hypothetical protein